MKFLKKILMLSVSAVVLNVWLFRFSKATPYRGGDATNMLEEFSNYGLSNTIVYVVGGLKILAALGLLLGLVYKKAIAPAATLMAVLMIGAIAMHVKVADEAIKYMPAGIMLVCSSLILLLNKKN
jgi:uncharacterized membrane protein YphA (DoxX/SURF4 family)